MGKAIATPDAKTWKAMIVIDDLINESIKYKNSEVEKGDKIGIAVAEAQLLTLLIVKKAILKIEAE